MYYLYVAIFGALGAVTRYWIGSLIGPGTFPFGTVLINITGCFLLALTVRYLAALPKLSKHLITGIGTGFIGAYTTFSTFSAETIQMAARGDGIKAVCYVLVSVLGGFLAAGFGFWLSDRLIGRKELTRNGD